MTGYGKDNLICQIDFVLERMKEENSKGFADVFVPVPNREGRRKLAKSEKKKSQWKKVLLGETQYKG